MITEEQHQEWKKDLEELHKIKVENKQQAGFLSLAKEQMDAYQAEIKRLRGYIDCVERMIKDKEMPFTYQEWEEVVSRLAVELEDTLEDNPEWEKTKDGKWKPTQALKEKTNERSD